MALAADSPTSVLTPDKPNDPRRFYSVDGSGTTVRLRFEDDGSGPDIASASRLYGAFTPRKGSDGPGLGLFAVHRIVRRLGGTMDPGVSDTGGLLHDIEIPAARS